MKANRLALYLLFMMGVAMFQLAGRQGHAERNLVADLRARATQGHTQSLCDLGRRLDGGSLGVAGDEAATV